MNEHHFCLFLALRLRHLQTWFLNAVSGDENRWHAFSSSCAGIKKSHWVPSQGCTEDDHSIRRFGRSKRLWFQPMFVFRISPNTLGVPLRIDRPTMLKWNSHHMSSFAKETGHHLLRSNFSTNNFHWIWIGFKDPHVGLLFCSGLINVFWGTVIVFLPTFLDTNPQAPLFLGD